MGYGPSMGLRSRYPVRIRWIERVRMDGSQMAVVIIDEHI